MINKIDKERYRRQLQIVGWGEKTQKRLGDARVTIVGAGGLGSPVAYYLAAAGVGRLRIIDCDEVELSNLNRQILHGQLSLGKEKVLSALDRLRELNGSICIEAFPERLDENTAERLCEGSRVLVDCLDSFSARMVLNRTAVQMGIPLVHAGIARAEGQITVVPPGGKPCLACLFPDVPDEENLSVIGAAAGIIGSMEALEVLKIISGLGEPLTGRLLVCDCLSADYREIRVQADPDCPVCG